MSESFLDPDFIERFRVGPLAPHLDAYVRLLERQGYSKVSAREQLRAIGRFSEWLRIGRRELHDVEEKTIGRFLQRDPQDIRRGDAAALHRLLRMLREIGASKPKAPTAPRSARRRVTDEYRRYLLQERGLSQATAVNYVPFVDLFLSERFRAGRLSFGVLRAPDITGFVQRHAHKLCPGRAQLLVTALRSFFRYLQHQGKIASGLASCVPTVARWSFSTLPKSLPTTAIRRVLEHCNRQTPAGRRDYAILLLLARLGLRAGEIVALTLEDLDWENGRITIRGKGGRWAQLPVPLEVGEAIADYLRKDRPRCSSRRVFIRERAPLAGFANSIAVSSLVMRSLRRAGVDSPRTGAHLFRHSLAADMLRHGASLDEIGDLLRHQSPNTTAIYAKVDLVALRTLALAWPGGGR
jgi:site-specific recombinase XerD